MSNLTDNYKKLITNKLFLAPMAGVTDLAFRMLCKEHGADFAVTEMISAEALIRNSKKTKLFLKTCKEEKPFIVQLFGYKIDSMVSAIKIAEKVADIIDINAGCPAKKITNANSGSALLSDLNYFKKYIAAIVNSTKKLITVKTRVGPTAKRFVKICENAGVSAITIHARTREQGKKGEPDWQKIKEIKKLINIPVIANGGITDKHSAELCKKITGADSLMIGRAAIGNPCVFEQIRGKTCNSSKLKLLLRWRTLAKKYKCFEFNRFKSHAVYFIKDKKLRNEISRTKTEDELMQILNV